MSTNKSRKHQHARTSSTSGAQPTCAYAQMDSMIAMLGHTDGNGNLHSKIDFSTSDKDGLQGLEFVFRQAMTKAIKQHDAVQFRKAYVAMECILGIKMEDYEGLGLHFPAEGKTLNTSPSEMCLAFNAWPIVTEIFKLSLAHSGAVIRPGIDSPSQLIFRLGSWLIESDLHSELAGITLVANEVVKLFLAEVKPVAKASGHDLKTLIQGIPFLKQFPPLEQIFWTQYAAMPV